MESSMVINLDQYRNAKVGTVGLKNGTYGDEIMNSNWNPTVVHMFDDVAPNAISPDLPEDKAAVDVDEFLSRVYALATQI